ncbi:MAG: DUF1573 domain-containing protein [Bacteroidota bacterium]
MKRLFFFLPLLAFVMLTACGNPPVKTQNQSETAPAVQVINDIPDAEPPTSPVLTQAKFAELEFDFGEMSVTEDFTHTFKLRNTGSEELVIEQVKPSCSCTTPDWTKEAIAPGEEGFITAKFSPKPEYRGSFVKTVTVTANTDPALTVLKITGEVVD